MEPNECSLWLMPEGEAFDYYFEIIARLSQRLVTPVFLPHVTLLGLIDGTNEEVEAKTVKLAAQFHPFRVEFTGVETFDEYFRCLFVRVKETPVLLTAHQQARQLFGRQDDPAFMPHLSLVYGDLEPLTKEKISNELGEECLRPFAVHSIHLFLTSGEPPDWQRFCEIPFGRE
jgi:2'-5' RNA ligase